MSFRVSLRTLKCTVAMAGVVVAAVSLSGCNSLGGRTFGDSTVTGSVAQSAPASLNQPMPASLGAPRSVQVAEQQFLPPANVGAAWGAPSQQFQTAPSAFAQPPGTTSPIGMGVARPTVQTQSLPALNSSSSMGTTQAMPAQQSLAPMPVVPAAVAMGNPSAANSALPVNSSVPMQSAPASGYMHTIASGESLYTIARKYDVTTQAIVQANNLGSPDKIVVGQKVLIPGRSDLIPTAPAQAATPDVKLASASPEAIAPTPKPLPAGGANVLQTPTAPAAQPVVQQAAAPAPAATPKAEPEMSGSDKFRWPVSGRVITDFAASRGTGINIDVPEGSTVKAAENGTVIYVGSGVEGYGNLILVRHPNGYVSAYAHLQNMNVAKGAVVNRGDAIGTVGMTGSVSRPQLHFELRKGATPVDPVPMLAS